MSTAPSDGVKVAETTANPAPLGLLGFGMTTILLSFHNAGIFPLDSMIMSMGLFVGGIAQIIAGIQEWKKNNTFGATAFSAYGAFWITLVASWILPRIASVVLNPTTGQPSTPLLGAASGELAMAVFLALWGLFTLGMFFGTLRLNVMLVIVFGTLTILFFGLATRDFLGAAEIEAGKLVGTVSGWVGIVCGLAAVYGSIAQVLNEVYGRTVLSIGPITRD